MGMMQQMRSRMGPGMAGGPPGVGIPGGGFAGGPGGLGGQPGGLSSQNFEEPPPATLVVLSVYGIASLYERYPPKPEQPADANAQPPAGGTK